MGCRILSCESTKELDMIQNQWYIVLESKEVGTNPLGVTRLGERLVFWRQKNNQVVCLKDQCVHRGAKISLGKVCDDTIQCPFHGFEYDSSGKCTFLPAYGKEWDIPDHFRIRSYPIHEQHGFIWIWWGKNPPPDLKPPSFFKDLDPTMSYYTIKDTWAIHYSRAIENQLDVMHLPFVHHNTIGRGNRYVVDGPLVEWVSEDMFEFYVYNRKDDGTPVKKMSELSKPDNEFKIEFIFPHLWQNHITNKFRLVIAFIPIDEKNSLLYLRSYQNMLRIPGLKRLFNILGMQYNKIILHQDRRVVLTQEPTRTEMKMGEKLVQGDRPIIEYRKHREKLLSQV